MSITESICKVLTEGPCTSRDIVVSIGVTPTQVRTGLYNLYKNGAIGRRKYYTHERENRGTGPNEEWIYNLPEHARWAA